MEMVDRIVARVELARQTSLDAALDMYYLYFKTAIYRTLYKAEVDDILTLDGHSDCIMTEAEILVYVP